MKKSLYIIAYCCFSLLEANCNGLSSDVKTNGVGSEALLKEQQSIISEFSEQIQSSEIVSLLNKLTANSIVVTSDSLTSIKENPESALIKLDMYDGANLPIFIRQSLDHILSSEDSSFKKLLGKIENNKKLHTTLTNLRDTLLEQEKYSNADFEDEEYSKIYADIVSSLSESIESIEADTSFTSKDAYFLDFLKLSKKFTELAFVRYNTEKMLSQIRASLEGIQGVTSSTSASLSINIPIPPVPGMTANLDLFASGNSYGSTGLSFYTVTKTKGTKFGITYNILPAKISGKITLENAAINLFYSLEAYMDFLNSSTPDINRLHAKIQGMDGVLKDRKELQAKEKEALANNGEYERLLRLFHVLPQTGSVSLIWVDITKSKALDKAKENTIGTEISASVAVPLSNLGITLKASKGVKTYTKGTPLLSMINDDCSVIDGMGIEDLEELVGSKNDLSKVISDSNLLLDTLQEYIFTLERLAVSTSASEKKEYEKKKHSYEKLLLPKGSTGREGVLKAAILTAAVLRKSAEDDQNLIKRFKKIYVQLCNLSKLGEFSKNKSGIRKRIGYGTKAVADSDIEVKINSLQASFTAQAPLPEENGKYMTLKFSLPLYSTGVVGMAILRERFKSVFAAVSKKKIPFNFDDFTAVSKAFGITKGVSTAANALTSVAPVGVSASGSSDFTFVWRYVEPLKDTSDIVPLPGQKLLTNEKGPWALDFIVASSSLNAAVNASSKVVDLPIALKLSASMGKLAKRTGPDTLHDLISKVNALLLGKVDSKSGESTAVSSLLKGQSGQILKIFRGIAKMDSNAAFELQTLYNSMLKSCKTKAEKGKIEQLFAEFIEACKNIVPATVEETQLDSGEAEAAELSGEETSDEDSFDMEQYKTAFDLFRQILDKQHTWVFKPYYDNAFAGKIDENDETIESEAQETEVEASGE